MRPARSCIRLCSRSRSLANAPRAAPTSVRRIHQDLSHIRRPQSLSLRPQAFIPHLCRHAFSTTARCSESAAAPPGEKQEVPQYQMTFTCKACTTRSSHRISKQGYHHGTVLISCPGCKNRHLISDHLKIFADQSTTLEDIMRDKGQLVKRGHLSEDGDLELWDDGSQTKHAPAAPRAPTTENTGSDNEAPGASFKSSS
ncbi:dnl zinc finger domain-containing protein [Diplodia corticola]|uniref:Dnl zinc finger domain-containing protein n=1 Tax=Diplodia corticola TaxID=236234 RepID=A0A1J9R9K3_9PEZI|nr:dnl zinc finger domain-containing protein [Diplodia corticola]OJD37216.1 dnl zinc finger domain-containing protein [Diplodia corticola]